MPHTVDPQWTDHSDTMRVLDPLGVESTESTLQSRMFHPVLSMAVTQRLRYLSYWCWVTSNLDGDAPDDRALYEKVVLLGRVPHDCPDEGPGKNGTLNPPDDVITALADPDVDEVAIDAETVSIGSEDTARFDSYYAGVLYNLLLLENDRTVTPLGETLSDAYAEAVAFDFESVQDAVEAEVLPRDLIEAVQTTGCFCQISPREQSILRKAYWYLISPTVEYDELDFNQDPSPDLLDVRDFLRTDDRQLEMAAVEAELLGVEAADLDTGNEDLEQFFEEGRPRFVRSALTLLLATGDWVDRRHTSDPPFDRLADARELWRLLIHAEYASYGIQTLLLAVQATVRELEPISPPEVLSALFEHEEFGAAVEQTLAGIELTVDAEEDRSVLEGVRDAVYFGEAPMGALTTSLPTTDKQRPDSLSWEDVQTQLLQADEQAGDSSGFHLTGHSERAYQHRLTSELSKATTVADYRTVAAIASVLLARISTREEQYFGTKPVEPFLAWFKTAYQPPGPPTCWAISEDREALSSLSKARSSWDASPFAYTAASFTKRWTLTKYFDRLFQKIGDSNGRSPQLLHVDADGRLTFDHQVNDGSLYNYGEPNAPTIKWDRLGEIGYELNLLTTDSLSSLSLSDAGREFVGQFLDDAR